MKNRGGLDKTEDKETKKKAIIAMSGGVDSSVAALLTMQTGDDCIGATMQLFYNQDIGISREKTCCSLNDVEDARSVAAALGMPFYVFNFSEAFRQDVMDAFAQSYLRGETPNPCIECNRCLKFGRMLHRMRELERDYVVTGHYAQITEDPEDGRYHLKKAADPEKDQSYVLYMLTQDQLAHIRFPLGGYTKEEVRAIAAEHGFVNAKKHDSQDICFVPDGDYAAFIERHTGLSSVPGNFVDRAGNVIGKHKGITHYTLGQRRGLGIPAASRLYVTGISPASQEVTLGSNDDLFSRHVTADQVNVIAGKPLAEPVRVTARIRYRHKEQPATAWQDETGILHVEFDEPQRAVTPGQAVVLYNGDDVLGGGTILYNSLEKF